MKRRVMITSFVALVVVAALSYLLVTRRPVAATIIPSPLAGKIAPRLSGSQLDGGTFDLAKDRGQIVVVNFWASWCVACVQEAPELSTFAWRERGRGVTLVGVVFNDTLSSARAFERHYGSLYQSIIDTNGAIANRFGVSAPPTTFVINRSGRIAVTLLGPVSASQLIHIIAEVH